MNYRIEIEAEVDADGKVHIDVPDKRPGHKVRVVVEDTPRAGERVFGRLKGKIEILPGFDDPVPGFGKHELPSRS